MIRAYEYADGAFIVDAWDTSTKKRLWRGSVVTRTLVAGT
jgi:hypothetical protein